MNRIRTAIISICLASLLPMNAYAGDLIRIYEQAKSNDAIFIAAQHARDAALESEPAARALLFPNLSASYTQTSDDTDTNIGFVDPVTNQPVTLSQTDGGSNDNLRVVLSQPLFNRESWYRLKQAGEQTALAELSYRSAEQALVLRVAEQYFQLLAAYGAVRSTTAEKEAIGKQLELSKQNLNVGLSSITDVQDVQARYDLSIVRQLDAEQSLRAAQEALEEIVAAPLEDAQTSRSAQPSLFRESAETPRLADLKEDADLPKPQFAEVAKWVNQAQETNFDVLAAALELNIAEREIDVAKSRYWPTVNATATYTDVTTEAGGFPTESSGTTVGVGVTLPLFAGGATRSAVRQALSLRDQRLSEFDHAKRVAEREVRTAHQSVMTGAVRIKAYKQAVISSNSALEASQAGLEIGTRSTLDMLNAQQQLYQAEREYDRSRYDYLLSLLRLNAIGGQLSQSDLSAIDALLAAG